MTIIASLEIAEKSRTSMEKELSSIYLPLAQCLILKVPPWSFLVMFSHAMSQVCYTWTQFFRIQTASKYLLGLCFLGGNSFE
jgi:hypothetical protein